MARKKVPVQMPAAPSFVEVDAEDPDFQEQLGGLEQADFDQVMNTLEEIERTTWMGIYQSQGYKWEKIPQQNPRGGTSYTLRVSQKSRAVVYRDGNFLRFISLHSDHDSAYKKKK